MAVPKKVETVEDKLAVLNGPMLLSDVQAALSDRYPHNDIHMLEGATIEVAVPGGVILVDFKAVNKCANTAELRAYIDSLPIQ
jgi:hypothetical protein